MKLATQLSAGLCRGRVTVARWATAVVLILLSPTFAAAQTAVDLLLVLAVDASGSVNTERFELQKEGYARAFRHPMVLKAIRTGPTQAIAVTATQWTGPTMQDQVVPWVRIHDEASAEEFAKQIAATQRRLFGGGTSVSGAIDHAKALFPQSPFVAPRHVIDVSGDGANNRGRSAEEARDEAVSAGIVINGLPILALEPYLDDYYLKNVIGGPGSFMVTAQDYESFADAVLKKLILEIASSPPYWRRFASRARPWYESSGKRGVCRATICS